MKLATYNIHFGVGRDGRCDLARALDAVRDVDIIGLQEVDSHWDRSGNVDQVELIRELMPEHDLAYGPGVEVVKRDAATGDVVRGRRRRSGNVVLSRYPILTARNFPLPKYGAAGPKLDIQKALIEVSVDTPLGPLRVYNTHLCHLSEEQRALQLAFLLDIHRRARLEGAPLSGTHPKDASFASEPVLAPVPDNAVLLGDLNLLPSGQAYDLLAGATGNRWTRVPRLGGFVDAWVAAGRDEQIGIGQGEIDGATSGDRTRRIDYCFVGESLADRVEAIEVRYDAEGSDHYPVVVTMA
ncbi:endonuclease/exonuclease/phosphatase family protein [Labrys wisconsinensis]|uniref:Endonuclease/exonuclease/phosphatase family metal-dependent hydrolase n=1 Tax=Labrys wisconsinensis TaxID=425677 RepID=A0ABU0J500_9HYPH|nr:endonuclease/exonuclease/phosphatase family protein [Labrys wisconsinensis]MDQ0469343.1 endonuclease/exonuclease/phosphatase family metal-dependent hydrolase [Labrys wisconsinensis]